MQRTLKSASLNSIFVILLAVSGFAQLSGTWIPSGSMSNGRYAISPVLLANGKVLVAGGVDGNGSVLASAELYDPASGTWSTTGSLNVARNMYLVTPLPNGKVLLAGGCTTSSCSAATPTAELYDPFTGTWSLTGSMAGIHYFSAATLLGNGKVLVEAGCKAGNCGGVTNAAELYDPATGKWSLTGSMKTARDYHTATLLSNGKVLVAGGYGNTGATNSAELYDPVSGSWSSAGLMQSARTQHSATLLPNGKVLVAGGTIGYLPSALCELFDPSTKKWTATGNMGTSRVGHPALLLGNGQVLVAGGGSFRRPKWYIVAGAELYNPKTGSWTSTGSMSTGRYEQGLVLLINGQALTVGGLGAANTGNVLSTAELYVP